MENEERTQKIRQDLDALKKKVVRACASRCLVYLRVVVGIGPCSPKNIPSSCCRVQVAAQKEKLSRFTKDFIPMEQQFTVCATDQFMYLHGSTNTRPNPGNTHARVQVNHKFHLDSEEAVYKVTVEAPLNLELVMLQSNKPMRLVDTESNQASHARVHTHARSDHGVVPRRGQCSAKERRLPRCAWGR